MVMYENEDIVNEVVIEFLKTANDYCQLVETAKASSKSEYISKLLLISSRIYFLAQILPSIESVNDENNEKFVNEEDWQKVKDANQTLLGQHDAFLEVFDPRMQESETPIISSISENIADIYQDIKDFILLYQIGTHDVMNDALWECKQNFEEFWGQKLANTIRALHNLSYGNNFLDDDDDETTEETETPLIDTSSWILSKRLEQIGDGEEDL